MPSLAQGYGRGLLLGLQLEEAKRRKQRDELSDEFLKERLEDMRFQRKTLMSQLKREEGERREAGLEKEQKGWRMAETGVGLRDLLLGAGITMPQAELAETEYYETEKIPKYAAEWITPPKAGKAKKPTWSEQEKEGDIQYLMRAQEITRQEAINILRQKRIYGLPEEEDSISLKELNEAIKAANDRNDFETAAELEEIRMHFVQKQVAGMKKSVFPGGVPMGTGMGEYARGITPKGVPEEEPINYESMAEDLREFEKIESQETLEAYKDQLLEHYPGLDWEELKSYFK